MSVIKAGTYKMHLVEASYIITRNADEVAECNDLMQAIELAITIADANQTDIVEIRDAKDYRKVWVVSDVS